MPAATWAAPGAPRPKFSIRERGRLLRPAACTYPPLTTRRGGGRGPVAGGTSHRVIAATAEEFDPATARFTAAGQMKTARYKAGSITLTDGRALIVGGAPDVEASHPFSSTELYDPATSTFSAGPAMAHGRYKLIDSVVRLGNGDVVVAGGAPTPEVYDSSSHVFRRIQGTLGP